MKQGMARGSHISRWCSALPAMLLLPALCGAAAAQDPGKALASVQGETYSLANNAIEITWKTEGSRLAAVAITDRRHGITIPLSTPFALLTKDGAIYNTANLKLDGRASKLTLVAQTKASRYAERLGGEEFDLPLSSADGSVRVTWSTVLRDGSAYARQLLTITAKGRDLPISHVELLDLRLPGAHVAGSVKGSPIVQGDFFLGFEHPLSESKVTGDRANAFIDRDLPLKSGRSVTYSSVIGVARSGQMRRDFLAYIERERAHPYRTFLHYNSWYDLGYFNAYDQQGALDRVHAFGQELHEKRGVTLDSYLFDDGWDNHASLWSFSSNFPNGFTSVREAAQRYGAAPGVWMSPWGGYDGPKNERIQFGNAAGFEIVDNGFALSGPKYYSRFRDVCLEMIRKYGVNQFKFDGTGNANAVFPGSTFDSDFDAAIHLIAELREARPDIYINLTTGTTPSPFWLLYADSIWRGGEDDDVAGVGPYRERWITYRDADTYNEIVKNGPLYPLNSLMLHGIIYAQRHKHLNADPGHDFRKEVRSYFGSGTQLQEMYITPSLLSRENWDDLAEAANWSRSNAEVLKDTHWIGGDPAWLEVYGWASWTPQKSILVLRNPSDDERSIPVTLQDALELPAGAPEMYAAKSPWKEDAAGPPVALSAQVPHTFKLKPFEVLTLDLTPP